MVANLRIAYVRSSLHAGSGLANHIMEIAKRIKHAGNEVAVISRETEIKSKDVPIHQVKFAGDSVPFIRNLTFPLKSLELLQQFDLIHSMYYPGILAGNVAAAFLDKPHVFTYHGFAPIRVWQNYKQIVKMIDHRMGAFLAFSLKVHRIITVSNFLKNELEKKYFIKNDKIRVIYNGVDTERFNPNVKGDSIKKLYKLENHPVVLYVGRLAPYKGIQFLIRAIPKVLTELPETKFVIGGAIRYDVPDLHRLIRKLKLKDSILFTGYVHNRELPKLYSCCDVFCYPSLWEGFGLTPAEAQASGKPVVAFNTCAIPEVIKNKVTGLLVEPGNDVALAQALLTLLQNDELRFRMALEARKRVLRLFSWDRAAEQTLDVYREVLA